MIKKWLQKLKTKPGAFFSLLAVSYIVFLLIMLLGVLAMYAYAETLISTETQKANTSILLNVKHSIDKKLESLKDFTYLTLSDMSNIEFVTRGSLGTDQERALASTMKKQELYNSNASALYITSYQSERTISYNGMWNSDFLYDSLFRDSISDEEFSSMRAKPVMPKFFRYSPPSTSDAKAGIACAASFLSNVWSPPLGDAIAVLDMAELTEAAEGINELAGSTLYLIDGNGELIFSLGDTSIAIPPTDQITLNGIRSIEENGSHYVVSAFSSDITPWTYIYLSPRSQYWDASQKLKIATLILFFVFLTFGIFCVFYFSFKNSVPVKRLITELGIKNEDKNNEFALISRYAQDLLSGKRELEQHLSAENELVHSTLLQQLLLGDAKQSGTLKSQLDIYDIRFAYSNFAVVLCQIEDFSKLYDCQEQVDFIKAEKSINFLLGNVGNELFSEFGACYCTSIYNRFAFLLCTRDEQPQEILATAGKLRDFFRTQLNVYISLSVSDYCRGLSSVATAYRDAARAFEYRFLMGRNTVITSGDCARFSQRYVPDHETQTRLLHEARQGNTEAACASIDTLFEAVSGSVCLDDSKSFVYDMITIASAIASEFSVTIGSREPQNLLLRCETLEELRGTLKDYISGLIAHRKQSSANQNLSAMVLRYIDEKYQDPTLNVDGIGEYMEMSASYISKIFKDQTGTPLPTYIQLVRISAAKKLLLKTNRSIENIAAEVGFFSGNTFIRIFKKHEGVTPGQYRLTQTK